MMTAFQKLLMRPDPGYAYDKSTMVEIVDGAAFTEALCKLTSKCDTSLLLLRSHKGTLKRFEVKLLGLVSPKAPSMSSAVFSGIKKGFGFLNGSSASEQSVLSDEEQMSQHWTGLHTQGYHGMQTIALIDRQMMPDNTCRDLYSLQQYMMGLLQSVAAYYMFQKPEEAFVSHSCAGAEALTAAYPDADTFAVSLVWEFEKDPQTHRGRVRATPIVGNSLSSPMPSPSLPRSSPFHTSHKSQLSSSGTPAGQRRRSNLLDATATLSARKTPRIGENISSSIFSTTPKANSSSKSSQFLSTSTSRSTRKSPVDVMKSMASADLNESLNKTEKVVSTTVTTTRKKVTELRDGSGTVKQIVEETTPKVVKTTRRSIVEQQSEEEGEVEQTEEVTEEDEGMEVDQEEQMEEEEEEEQEQEEEQVEQEEVEEAIPARRITAQQKMSLPRKLPAAKSPVKPSVKTPVKPAAKPAVKTPAAKTPAKSVKPTVTESPVKPQDPAHLPLTRRGRAPRTPAPCSPAPPRKRKAPAEEEEEEKEVTVRPAKAARRAEAPAFDASCLPFDDGAVAPAKPRGRASMAARASLAASAQAWDPEEQRALLHFYDNINPACSDTSRVALTCKYALLQYDRDLSSKLLFTWLGKKGREVLTEVTNFTLEEAKQKEAVLALYRSLSEAASEASRAGFTLKFCAAQYGISANSKQLFAWLKGK